MRYVDQHVDVEQAQQSNFLSMKKMLVEEHAIQTKMAMSLPHGAIMDHRCFQKAWHLEEAIAATQAVIDLCVVSEQIMREEPVSA